MVTDVFTREAVTRALPNKNAETVARAAAEAIPDLVQDEGSYVVTTDEGNEFRTLEGTLPQGVVRRQKRPEDRNATAVVDRTIQPLKKDLAGKVDGRRGCRRPAPSARPPTPTGASSPATAGSWRASTP